MKKFLLSALFLAAAALVVTSCNDDDDDAGTILTELKADADFSSLVAALERAGLDQVFEGGDQLTLFAPDNAAFTALLNDLGVNSLNDVPVDLLTSVLLNHVVAGEVRSGDLSDGYVNSLLPYGASTTDFVSLYVNLTSGVKINDATVTQADIDASNGVIHQINKVMLPATVVTHALNNPEFSSLVAALTRSDLGIDYVSILSGPGPYTVFAPTNAAFASLLTELGYSNLNQIPANVLNNVLQYHVVSGTNVREEDIIDDQVVTSLLGQNFVIDLTGGAKIKDANNRTSNIILTNVQGDNGVVHAIDKVILPL